MQKNTYAKSNDKVSVKTDPRAVYWASQKKKTSH